MATPTLEDLLAPQTSDEVLGVLLQRLAGQGFPVTTWQPGDMARTLLQLYAEGFADAGALLVAIASGGFVALSAGDWLTLCAKQVYGLDRTPALFTEGACVLAATATSSGYTIVPGQLVAVSASGLRFFNTTGGNLAAGGTLSLTFQAETAGSAYNVSVGSITALATPLPGVTVSNPTIGTTGTWITSLGTDEETDASLEARCEARWPSLALVPTVDVFDLWAKAASAQVTRTKPLTDGAVAGQVDLYLAGSSGGVDAATVTAVQAYVDARILLTSTCVVASAVTEAIEVQATLYVRAGYEATAQAAAQVAVEAYISGSDINGTIYESDVVADLQNPTGVRNVTVEVLARQSIGAGVGDVDLSVIAGGPHVATPAVTLTVVTA